MGVKDATIQLQSYMSNSANTSYGIATDGNEIKILNNKFEEIDDIPKFNINMMPTSVEMFEYIDLKFNRSHEFLRDTSNSKDIVIDDSNENLDVIGVPIFNEIAAGQPILINDELQGLFYLPNEWIKSSRDTFILKIKGDSMIKANINDGDLVVIKKQNTANNGEIAAVDVGGSATLKRLMMMGSNIIFGSGK